MKLPGVILSLATLSLCHGELYTAIADLEQLLFTEEVLLGTLERYIELEQGRLNSLKRKYLQFQHELGEAMEDSEKYLSNPINAYLLVKRLMSDWKDVEKTIVDSEPRKSVEANFTDYKSLLRFPSDEDLTGAATALIRLQDTYGMDTSSVANGELNGVKYSSQLTASDCFELGRQVYNEEDYYHTVLWMREALRRHEKERNETSIPRWEILEYLAFSTYKQGNVVKALELTNELLTLNPLHNRALGNKAYYEHAIQKGDLGGQNDQGEIENPYSSKWELYELACRGALSPPADYTAKLKCRYVHKNNPFLRLAPLKEEEAYLQPRIVIYHQILSDDEIDTIKKLAHPRLRRSSVQNQKTGALEPAHYRISKGAWLKDEEHEVIEALSRRVEDMTGLSASTAEELQVVNYGIGGHYESHFDFAGKRETEAFKTLGTGNRIATVLFYLTDVAQGGATVFPLLNLSLWPEKGSAAFWFNLHPSGSGDYLTRHAACPVLTGTKWVANRWFHERGQEFLRPCDLEKDSGADDWWT